MTDLLEYLPLFSILIYLPLVCISDLRTRRFNPLYFIPLILVNIFPLYNYMIGSPEDNYSLMYLTLGLCVILFVLALIGGIGGADFIFASLIMIFMQYNPLVFPRVFFALDFFWTLLLVTFCLPIIIWVYNFFQGNLWGDEVISKKPYTFVQMLTSYPRGIPFMLPISIAFVATIVMELIV